MPGTKSFQGCPGHWWAYLSNTPYRMFKAYANQGGISSPLIVYHPKQFAKNKILSKNYFHFMDIMPTCLELAGVKYPDSFGGKPTKTPYHKNMLPYLKNTNFKTKTDKNRVLCWEHQGHQGVRKGKWKLVFIREVYNYNPFKKEMVTEIVNQWALYDLENDPFENNNVYNKYPKIVEELNADFAEWAKNTGVVPWDKVNIWK